MHKSDNPRNPVRISTFSGSNVKRRGEELVHGRAKMMRTDTRDDHTLTELSDVKRVMNKNPAPAYKAKARGPFIEISDDSDSENEAPSPTSQSSSTFDQRGASRSRRDSEQPGHGDHKNNDFSKVLAAKALSGARNTQQARTAPGTKADPTARISSLRSKQPTHLDWTGPTSSENDRQPQKSSIWSSLPRHVDLTEDEYRDPGSSRSIIHNAISRVSTPTQTNDAQRPSGTKRAEFDQSKMIFGAVRSNMESKESDSRKTASTIVSTKHRQPQTRTSKIPHPVTAERSETQQLREEANRFGTLTETSINGLRDEISEWRKSMSDRQDTRASDLLVEINQRKHAAKVDAEKALRESVAKRLQQQEIARFKEAETEAAKKEAIEEARQKIELQRQEMLKQKKAQEEELRKEAAAEAALIEQVKVQQENEKQQAALRKQEAEKKRAAEEQRAAELGRQKAAQEAEQRWIERAQAVESRASKVKSGLDSGAASPTSDSLTYLQQERRERIRQIQQRNAQNHGAAEDDSADQQNDNGRPFTSSSSSSSGQTVQKPPKSLAQVAREAQAAAGDVHDGPIALNSSGGAAVVARMDKTKRTSQQVGNGESNAAKFRGQILQSDAQLLKWRQSIGCWGEVKPLWERAANKCHSDTTVMRKRHNAVKNAIEAVGITNDLMDRLRMGDKEAQKEINLRVQGHWAPTEGGPTHDPQVETLVQQAKSPVTLRLSRSEFSQTTATSCATSTTNANLSGSFSSHGTVATLPPALTTDSESESAVAHPNYGGKKLDENYFFHLLDVQAKQMGGGADDSDDESADEEGDYSHYIYQVVRRDLGADEVDDGEGHDDLWRVKPKIYENPEEANIAASHEIFKLKALYRNGSFTLHCQDQENGLMYYLASSPAFGQIEVAVQRELRTTDEQYVPDAYYMVPKTVYYVKRRVTQTKSDETVGGKSEEVVLQEKLVGNATYTDLYAANDQAIQHYVDLTLPRSVNLTIDARARRQEFDHLSNMLIGEDLFEARKGDRGDKEMIEVWVEKGQIIGPRNL